MWYVSTLQITDVVIKIASGRGEHAPSNLAQWLYPPRSVCKQLDNTQTQTMSQFGLSGGTSLSEPTQRTTQQKLMTQK